MTNEEMYALVDFCEDYNYPLQFNFRDGYYAYCEYESLRDFYAQLSGSGHSVHGSSAQVGVQPGLFLVPLFTQLSAHFAKIAMAGPGGKVILKDRVTIGQAGELVKSSSHNNRAEVDLWNSLGRWDANAAPGSRPTQAYDYSTYEYRVDPAQFATACLDAARTMNRIYVDAANVNRPAS